MSLLEAAEAFAQHVVTFAPEVCGDKYLYLIGAIAAEQEAEEVTDA